MCVFKCAFVCVCVCVERGEGGGGRGVETIFFSKPKSFLQSFTSRKLSLEVGRTDWVRYSQNLGLTNKHHEVTRNERQ